MSASPAVSPERVQRRRGKGSFNRDRTVYFGSTCPARCQKSRKGIRGVRVPGHGVPASVLSEGRRVYFQKEVATRAGPDACTQTMECLAGQCLTNNQAKIIASELHDAQRQIAADVIQTTRCCAVGVLIAEALNLAQVYNALQGNDSVIYESKGTTGEMKKHVEKLDKVMRISLGHVETHKEAAEARKKAKLGWRIQAEATKASIICRSLFQMLMTVKVKIAGKTESLAQMRWDQLHHGVVNTFQGVTALNHLLRFAKLLSPVDVAIQSAIARSYLVCAVLSGVSYAVPGGKLDDLRKRLEDVKALETQYLHAEREIADAQD